MQHGSAGIWAFKKHITMGQNAFGATGPDNPHVKLHEIPVTKEKYFNSISSGRAPVIQLLPALSGSSRMGEGRELMTTHQTYFCALILMKWISYSRCQHRCSSLKRCLNLMGRCSLKWRTNLKGR